MPFRKPGSRQPRTPAHTSEDALIARLIEKVHRSRNATAEKIIEQFSKIKKSVKQPTGITENIFYYVTLDWKKNKDKIHTILLERLNTARIALRKHEDLSAAYVADAIPRRSTLFLSQITPRILRTLQTESIQKKKPFLATIGPSITKQTVPQIGLALHQYNDRTKALDKSDLIIVNCVAITPGNILVSDEDAVIIEESANQDTKVILLADGWHFVPATRSKNILNQQYAYVRPEQIHIIVTELGLLGPTTFIEQVKKEYPWLTSVLS